MKCIIKVTLRNTERLCGSQVCIKCGKSFFFKKSDITISVVTYREWEIFLCWEKDSCNILCCNTNIKFAYARNDFSQERNLLNIICCSMQIEVFMKLLCMWSMQENIYFKKESWKTSSAITCVEWEKQLINKC